MVPIIVLGEMSGASTRTRIPGVSERSKGASSPAADTDANRQARVSKASALLSLIPIAVDLVSIAAARLPGHIGLLMAHTFHMQFAQGEFLSALGRFKSSMREKFGSEVSARESKAGDEDRDQEIVKIHVKHPCVIGWISDYWATRIN